MSVLALLLSAVVAMAALSVMWVRITARNSAMNKHRRMTSHLNWAAPAQGRRRLSTGKARRA